MIGKRRPSRLYKIVVGGFVLYGLINIGKCVGVVNATELEKKVQYELREQDRSEVRDLGRETLQGLEQVAQAYVQRNP